MDDATYETLLRMPTFGRVLKFLMEDRGLSQKEVAHLSGLHENTVSNTFNGATTPTLETLNKMGRALGTDGRTLYAIHAYFEETKTGQDTRLVLISRKFEALSSETVKDLAYMGIMRLLEAILTAHNESQ